MNIVKAERTPKADFWLPVNTSFKTDAIFSWKLAYDNLGSAGVLKEVFEEHWFTFLVLATALFGGGLCITATRLLAKCALRSAFAKQFSRVLMYFSGLTFLVYLVYCAAIRPPIKALQVSSSPGVLQITMSDQSHVPRLPTCCWTVLHLDFRSCLGQLRQPHSLMHPT